MLPLEQEFCTALERLHIGGKTKLYTPGEWDKLRVLCLQTAQKTKREFAIRRMQGEGEELLGVHIERVEPELEE